MTARRRMLERRLRLRRRLIKQVARRFYARLERRRGVRRVRFAPFSFSVGPFL